MKSDFISTKYFSCLSFLTDASHRIKLRVPIMNNTTKNLHVLWLFLSSYLRIKNSDLYVSLIGKISPEVNLYKLFEQRPLFSEYK